MAVHQASDTEGAIAAIARSLADMLFFLHAVSPKHPRTFARFRQVESTRRRLLMLVERPTSDIKSQKSLSQGIEEVRRHIQLIQHDVFHSYASGASDVLGSIDGVTITAADANTAFQDLKDDVDRLEEDLEGVVSGATRKGAAAANQSPVSPVSSSKNG
jgi:hypothetical protein